MILQKHFKEDYMKKIICILTVCLCVLNTSVSAASLGDMTKKVMDYFQIEVTEDTSGINRLQNRRSIKNPALISAAISSKNPRSHTPCSLDM